jgi:hypothetical protein
VAAQVAAILDEEGCTKSELKDYLLVAKGYVLTP